MTTRVWIAQCLCPDRHCICALTDEIDDRDDPAPLAEALAKALADTVRKMLAEKLLNPWCGLCEAPEASWHFEVARTRFDTLEAARASFERTTEDQAMTRAIFGDMDRSRLQ